MKIHFPSKKIALCLLGAIALGAQAQTAAKPASPLSYDFVEIGYLQYRSQGVSNNGSDTLSGYGVGISKSFGDTFYGTFAYETMSKDNLPFDPNTTAKVSGVNTAASVGARYGLSSMADLFGEVGYLYATSKAQGPLVSEKDVFQDSYATVGVRSALTDKIQAMVTTTVLRNEWQGTAGVLYKFTKDVGAGVHFTGLRGAQRLVLGVRVNY